MTRKESSFGADVFKLVGGTTLTQALSMLVVPILSRLYTPDAFGTAAVFGSITSIIGVVACLRYELAIVLPERDEDAASLLAASLFFVLAVTGLSAIPALFAYRPIVGLLNAPDLATYLWLVPVAVLANGGFLALSYWNSRMRQFGRLSIARVSRSVVVRGAELGMGIGGQAHAGGLIGSSVLGSVIVAAALGRQIWRDDRQVLTRGMHWQGMLAGARHYWRFPVFDIWSSLLNTIGGQLPALLLAFFFSPIIVGYHAVGLRLIDLPLSLIGSAIAQVFFQRAAEANLSGNLRELVEMMFQRLVAFGLFPLLTLAVVGRDMFVVVFGEKWAEAGIYTQILSLWAFFRLVSSPLSTLLRVLDRQQTALYLNCVIFALRLFPFLIGGYLRNARIALCLFSLSGAIIYGWYAFYILSLAGASRDYGRNVLLRHTLWTMPGLVILLGLQLGGITSVLVGVVVAMLLTLVYEMALVFKDPEMLAWVRSSTHRCMVNDFWRRWDNSG